MKQLIYLDNAATTKTRPEVVEAMLPYFTEFMAILPRSMNFHREQEGGKPCKGDHCPGIGGKDQ